MMFMKDSLKDSDHHHVMLVKNEKGKKAIATKIKFNSNPSLTSANRWKEIKYKMSPSKKSMERLKEIKELAGKIGTVGFLSSTWNQ